MPRTFEQFPEDVTCPVCQTNDQGQCVLVQIDGTGDGNIAEAVPVHLACAVASNFRREIGVLYRRVRENQHED